MAALILRNDAAALAMLRKATELSPRNANYWCDLAVAHLAAGAGGDASEVDAALHAASRAVALDPTLAAAEFNRAIALERLGDADGAARAYDRCLLLDPSPEWMGEVRIRRDRLAR